MIRRYKYLPRYNSPDFYMAENPDIKVLSFSCACKQVTGSINVPKSKLPLPLTLCHCNICRHQSGLLCNSYVTITDFKSSFRLQGVLSGYKSSQTLTRFFCSRCGSNVYLEDSKDDDLEICSGSLMGNDSITELKNHIFTSDTTDGGLSPWIPKPPGWVGFPKSSKQVDCGSYCYSQDSKAEKQELQCHCQCRGVQFKIHRPNEASKNVSSPFGDMLVPYVTGSSSNDKDVKWWLRRKDTKYLAATCACDSCRLASGFDIQTWAFVPKINMSKLNGDPIDFKNMGSLKQYRSSEGVYREFCETCGANVFWRCDARPGLVDVSVGLLDAEEGARAESWLEWWTDRVSFEEEAQNKSLISSLRTGLKEWGEKNSSTREQ